MMATMLFMMASPFLSDGRVGGGEDNQSEEDGRGGEDE